MFDKAFFALIGNEGGYSNHLTDPGGETMWGVTKRVARAHGYKGEMKDLPLYKAKEIYKASYWDDEFDNWNYLVAFNVFDAAVNHGKEQAIKLLQRSLGVPESGIVDFGLRNAVAFRNPYQIVCYFNSERLKFYTSIRNWPIFGKGWSNRVADNLGIRL